MKNKERFVWIFLLLGIIGILTGCATTASVKEIKLPTPGKIETFQISPLTLKVLDEAPGQRHDKLLELLERELKVQLSKNNIQVDEKADKTLQVSIKKITIINPAIRLIPLVGSFGQSTIEADVSLLDKDNASLTEFQVSSRAGIRGAVFELDAMQRITRKLAQEIVRRVKSFKVQK